MSQTIDELPTPCLLVDLDRLQRNIDGMQQRCDALGVRLRPHIKTHKCVEIGRLQRDAGASGITAATLEEAEAFAAAGFDDITWAFPLILSRIHQAVQLARRVRLGIVVDSLVAIEALAVAGTGLRVWLKVDCGYHRAGVDPDSDLAPRAVVALHATGQKFAGLLSHSGNAYDAGTTVERAAVTEQERSRIVALAQRLRVAGHVVPDVSIGSTPGITAAGALPGVSEVRPGNYAFYDLMQTRLGSCAVADCALTLLASVVSSSADRAVVDAGALALSKDPGIGPPTMGEIFADYAASDLANDLRVVGLSQEHGKLSRPLPVGTRVRILPNHSCLTAACFSSCYAVRGHQVVDRWRVFNSR